MKINANGIELFYEKCGHGSPIILLHGNGESHEIFNGLIEALKDKYTVYALDSRCHGKSGGGEISYALMASDVAALIKAEGIKKPVLYGFSDGGITGLTVALNYPGLIGKLIISGANLNPKGIKKRYLVAFKLAYFVSRSKLIKLMLTEPNINPHNLNAIDIPVLITAGKKDMIKKSHTKEIAANIKNGKLTILKGENHFSYVKDNKKLYRIIEPLL